MLTPAELAISVQIGAIAALFVALMLDDMPLHGYYQRLANFYNIAPDWIAWIAKPLGYCGFCFSFWVGVFGGLAADFDPLGALVSGAISTIINNITNR